MLGAVTGPMNIFFFIPILRALRVPVLVAGSLWAQASFSTSSSPTSSTPTSTSAKTETAYLLRLERVRNRRGVCVLLRGNGQYHLERHTPDKVRVYEGNLDSNETQLLVHIVSGDQLYRLEQKQIAEPMIRVTDDQVILAVLRPRDLWQELLFPDLSSREPYRESLVPLLEWLDHLEKRKGREISEEEGRNNCRPVVTPELTRRPVKSEGRATNNTSAVNPSNASDVGPNALSSPGHLSLLRLGNSAFVKGALEMSCIAVLPSGEFHYVKQSRDYGSKRVRSWILDGRAVQEQIAALRQLLDDPELRKSPVGPPPAVFTTSRAGEPTQTMLWFLRDGALQKFEAWQSLQIVSGRPTGDLEEHGMKTLLPLRRWIKANVDEAHAVPAENPPNANCKVDF